MAEQVKGMNIPIDADSTEAQKSMKQLNAEIKTSAVLADKYQKSLTFDDEGIVALQKQFKQLEEEETSLVDKQKQLNTILADMEDSGNAGTVAYKRLQIQLVSTDNALKSVANEQERVNKDIKAMETQQFDELSNKSKYANQDMKDLQKEMASLNEEASTSDISGYAEQLAEGAGASDLFGKATKVATLALNPYTIAIAGASAGLKVYTDRVKKGNEATKAFTYNLEISTEDMDALGKQASVTGKSFGLDYTESLDIANQTMRIFGDQINSTADFNKYFADTLMISTSELLDYDTVQTEINSNQANFNMTVDESTQLMASQVKLMQDYGRAADDSVDTFIEWGDTLSAVGLDSESSMRLFAMSMEAGARSTDEVANAVNEFSLNMTEAEADTKEALTKIGLNYDTLVADIQSKGIESGLLQVVNGMNEFYTATAKTEGEFNALNQTMAIGFTLMGTPGEEFVSTFATNTEAVNGLNEAIEISQTREQALADVTSDVLQPAYDDFQKNTLATLGGEAQRYNNILQNQGKLSLLSALITDQKLTPALETLGITIGSLPEKYQNIATQIQILTDSESSWNEKKYASNQLMSDETALMLGNDEVMKARNDTLAILATLESKSATETILSADAQEQLTTSLYASSTALNQYQGPMGSLSEELERSIELNSEYEIKQKDIEKAVTNLKNGTADYAMYLEMANTETAKGVGAQVLSNEQYERASTAVEQANKAYGGTKGTGYTAQFLTANQTADDGAQLLDEYNTRVEDSKTDLDKMRSALEKNTRKMEDFNTETEKALKNMDHLNSSTETYNDTPVSSKSVNTKTQSATVNNSKSATKNSATFRDINIQISTPDNANANQIAELTGQTVSQALYDYAG
jgi:hypothetical protein